MTPNTSSSCLTPTTASLADYISSPTLGKSSSFLVLRSWTQTSSSLTSLTSCRRPSISCLKTSPSSYYFATTTFSPGPMLTTFCLLHDNILSGHRNFLFDTITSWLPDTYSSLLIGEGQVELSILKIKTWPLPGFTATEALHIETMQYEKFISNLWNVSLLIVAHKKKPTSHSILPKVDPLCKIHLLCYYVKLCICVHPRVLNFEEGNKEEEFVPLVVPG